MDRREYKKVNCQRCWKEMSNSWWGRKYCSRCRVEVDKELRQKYKK